jgi:hypothetical protein
VTTVKAPFGCTVSPSLCITFRCRGIRGARRKRTSDSNQASVAIAPYNDELVSAFLEANPGKGICNDCLARELGLPHAAPIRVATHRVAHKPRFEKKRGRCDGRTGLMSSTAAFRWLPAATAPMSRCSCLRKVGSYSKTPGRKLGIARFMYSSNNGTVNAVSPY